MDLFIWIVAPGRQLVQEQLTCPFCETEDEEDMVFGEPRYDPDATVQVVNALAKKPDDDLAAVPEGLLGQCQGLWYHEDGQKLGNVKGDQIAWCEHTFDGEPSKLTAASDVDLTMELDGESHSATFQEGPPQKLVWSDGEVWVRSS